jgi:predicted nucleic acid-binding Zn ribbon protein
MNVFDAAQELEMFERECRLANTLSSAPVILPRGECLSCEAPLPSPLRFCDVDCCRDWENQQEARRRNGFKLDETD